MWIPLAPKRVLASAAELWDWPDDRTCPPLVRLDFL
ncbi:hypothetical protein CGMCC3_g4990 [Colletotrichum fructicola]|nr:uncharacterized protein CGMCC3_g4990 [Colletotrichum fructicola]KAE9578695.1 hypothetical protein CGMCC3_g4990 [Colletotrichum fructicola]